MPKSKSRKNRQSDPQIPVPLGASATCDEDLELESFDEPSWLADGPADNEAEELEAPAWLEASSSAGSAVQTVAETVAPSEVEEPEDMLFLASEALADLATMDNAVRRGDIAAEAPQPGLPLVFDEFPDEFPDEPEWAAKSEPEVAPQLHAPSPPQPYGEAEAQRADATLQSIVDEIDSQMAHRSSATEAAGHDAFGYESRTETATAQHVVFYLGTTRYSLPIEAVIEVSTVPRITALPGIPHYVRGVANLRGEILPVLDMRGLIGLPRISNAVLERMLVVRFAEQDAVVGFVVDRIRGLARLDQTRIAHPQGLAEDAVLRFLEGVTEHEDEVLNVLSARKIFLSEEVRRLSGI